MSLSSLIAKVNKKYEGPHVKSFPTFRPGDTVIVHVRVTEAPVAIAPASKNAKEKKSATAEAAKTRIQIFEGIVIAINKKNSINGSFRVRKMSYGIGVERVFPFHSPNVTKIEIVSRGKSRRAKHFYLRDKEGKNARIAIDYDRKE